MSKPRAYVACLASYNNGDLHGSWIELDGGENISERIAKMLASSPAPDAEEYAIHDHEFCGDLHEYSGIDDLNKIADAYETAHSEGIEWADLVAYCEYQSEDLTPEAVRTYQERFAGSASSIESWCDDYLEDSGQIEEIPDNLRSYFNIEAYARDMEINDVFTIDRPGEILVFWHQ